MPMALNSTMYVFTVRLADADRGVYETLTLRMAQHPSETLEYLITRLLAYCLEYTEGIAFSQGLSEPESPAIAVHDLTGALRTWIDVGMPEAGRLHKASKASPRVAVYAHREVGPWFARIAGDRIHRREAIEIHVIEPALIATLAARLERRMDLDLAITERDVYVSVADETYSGAVTLHRLPAGA